MRDRVSGKDVPFQPLDARFEPSGPTEAAVDTLALDELRPFGSER